MLYDEFDIFTSEIGESIYSYYLRFTKLINDMRMILMTMLPMQINTKFVNQLQLEWSRFLTAAKQAKDLHSVNFDQLYAFLKHNEKDAKEFKDKILLAQPQEAGVVLNEEQLDFLADCLEETNDCDDLQLQATANSRQTTSMYMIQIVMTKLQQMQSLWKTRRGVE
ncbi:hypothetical protein Tco_0767701 [Tanacetum coccineum]